MTNPLCILRTLWRVLRYGKLISGHDYVEDMPWTKAEVSVLKCRCCGRYDVSWR